MILQAHIGLISILKDLESEDVEEILSNINPDTSIGDALKTLVERMEKKYVIC